MLKKAIFLVALICSFPVGACFAAQVGNLSAERDENEMVFTYDLKGEKGEHDDTVNLTVIVAGKTYSGDKLHLDGDIGKVRVGSGKKIRWNVLADFPAGLSEEPAWEIYTGRKGFRDPTTGMQFVFVKGGCYKMGDVFGGGGKEERPAHEVCVNDFYLGAYEVTQGEWQKVMGSNPSFAKACGERCPVENVSWDDVTEFLRKLAKASGKKYRLPTEAEWEYAARSGGKKEKWAGTSKEREVKNYAAYLANARGKIQPVGKKRPNGLGLYDMSGNVWEWVGDYYDPAFYGKSKRDNPTGPDNGLSRVQRGGSCNEQPAGLRTTRRVKGKQGTASANTGFRIVLPAQ
ncbi:MAG TPA: SUMF1/EgtB/PvdO family nonheme iron enzyme [Geobacteraceae bacterium]